MGKVQFSLPLGEGLKKHGMEQARLNRAASLMWARRFLRNVAMTRADRCVTADDAALVASDLGPAAGSLFKERGWQFTGRWVKSWRVSNHARMIRVWRYVGP